MKVILFIFLSINILFANETNNSQIDSLTKIEEAWLNEHKDTLRVGITQIPNQVLIADDGYRGYAIDLFKKIASLLNIKFQYIYYDTWQEVLNAGKNHEIDIVFLAQKTPQRMKLYNFSDIVLVQHNKIITGSKHNLGLNVSTLFQKRVAVVRDSAIYDYILKNYPQIHIITTASEIESLEKLVHKEVDYTIAEPVRISYYISRNNIDNVYITGDFPYEYKLRIASRNDLPILNMILNKAIEKIPLEAKKALALKWGYEEKVFFDQELLLKILLFFIFIMLITIYLFTLNRQLQKTKNSLHELNATLEERVAREVEKNREKELMMLNQARLAQMGQILNMIAHQWRQPLNNLMLVNQTLILKYKKNQGAIELKDMSDFKSNSTKLIHQMSKTIDDFRDFFKPKKATERFCLNEMIEHLLNIVEPVFQNLQINLKYNAQKKFFIKGYQNELAQAILNILYNAKDALLDVKNKERCIGLSVYQENDNVIIQIKDNAGGIPDEIMDQIFHPYFSTKEKKNGTGLGLYMSKLIIQKHDNALLSVYNEEDGAVFEIKFRV